MPTANTVPFQEAVDRLDARTPVGANLRTREWDRVPAAIKDRAFFSAGVEDTRILSEMKARIDSDLRLNPDQRFNGRSGFVADMRRTLGAAPGDSGRLTDITSRRRLELIYRMNTEEAFEFGRHKTSQAPALREAFPARELIRVESREVPRSWRERWTAAGGKLYGGRMIALLNDPIWTAISRFGRPYPPFDFGSGMGLATVERAEAERLGVIARGEVPPAEQPEMNAALNAGARGPLENAAARAELKRIFGDQVQFTAGKAIWSAGQLVDMAADVYETGSAAGRTLRLGQPTAWLTASSEAAAERLAGRSLTVSDEDVLRNLTADTAEDYLPVRPEDFAWLNSVWMTPKRVFPNARNGSVGMEMPTRSGVIELRVIPDPAEPDTARLISFRKRAR